MNNIFFSLHNGLFFTVSIQYLDAMYVRQIKSWLVTALIEHALSSYPRQKEQCPYDWHNLAIEKHVASCEVHRGWQIVTKTPNQVTIKMFFFLRISLFFQIYTRRVTIEQRIDLKKEFTCLSIVMKKSIHYRNVEGKLRPLLILLCFLAVIDRVDLEVLNREQEDQLVPKEERVQIKFSQKKT